MKILENSIYLEVTLMLLVVKCKYLTNLLVRGRSVCEEHAPRTAVREPVYFWTFNGLVFCSLVAAVE